jgi:hypothetical protein
MKQPWLPNILPVFLPQIPFYSLLIFPRSYQINWENYSISHRNRTIYELCTLCKFPPDYTKSTEKTTQLVTGTEQHMKPENWCAEPISRRSASDHPGAARRWFSRESENYLIRAAGSQRVISLPPASLPSLIAGVEWSRKNYKPSFTRL